MEIYTNEKELVQALFEKSKKCPDYYFYPFASFLEAKILKMKRLNSEAPTDCMILSYGRAYYKNGKRKSFTTKQKIRDQQTRWK
tara:strand:- start:433 stop:684 length:252 start_codon:yes stop_codon:yes gene_type:complete